MSRQMLILIGLLLATFGFGIGLGLYLGGGTSRDDASDRAAGASSSGTSSWLDAEDRRKDNTVLSNRIRELEKQLAEGQQSQNSTVADRMAFFKKYHNELHVQAFSAYPPGITPEMAAILNLTKSEVTAVNEHMAAAVEKMKQMQEVDTVYAKQNANSVTYETPANPEGKIVQADLAGALAGDIGQDRANFLTTINDSYYSDPFSGFAQQKVETNISWVQQNGETIYTWKETGIAPDGHEMGSSWSSGSSLPSQYQKLLQGEPGP